MFYLHILKQTCADSKYNLVCVSTGDLFPVQFVDNEFTSHFSKCISPAILSDLYQSQCLLLITAQIINWC